MMCLFTWHHIMATQTLRTLLVISTRTTVLMKSGMESFEVLHRGTCFENQCMVRKTCVICETLVYCSTWQIMYCTIALIRMRLYLIFLKIGLTRVATSTHQLCCLHLEMKATSFSSMANMDHLITYLRNQQARLVDMHVFPWPKSFSIWYHMEFLLNSREKTPIPDDNGNQTTRETTGIHGYATMEELLKKMNFRIPIISPHTMDI